MPFKTSISIPFNLLKQKTMNQNLKIVLIAFGVCLAFKVLDRLFIDKAMSSVFNWEEETNFETAPKTKVVPIGYKKRPSFRRAA